MRFPFRLLAALVVVVLLVTAGCLDAYGAGTKRTVCTITVNSPDEKEAMRKRLPPSQYDFVELVEKGREDWLRSSCTRGVQCDALVISGHFNAGETFYSDRIDNADHLAIDELERASCSGSCPGIFENLKEVYLFGCESLNPDATKYSSAYGESGRSRMRRIFSNVPAIYGFSGPAPVGPTAAMLLNRSFDTGATIGTGKVSQSILRAFSKNSMVTVRGVGSSGPEAQERANICTFFDDRQSDARKLDFVHKLLKKEGHEVQGLLPRVEKLALKLDTPEKRTPEVQEALAKIGSDGATRERFLAASRAVRDPQERARRMTLARELGWLTPEQLAGEQLAIVDAMLARDRLGFAEVDLACSLNAGGTLEMRRNELRTRDARSLPAAHAAVLGCLGDPEAHAQALRALGSARDEDVQVAQAYLRHRPLEDPRQLREVASGIVRMPNGEAQVRAYDTLASMRVSDREILDELARAFAAARSVNVQKAIAGVFLRAGDKRAELVDVVRRHRLDAPGSGGVIDAVAGRQ